MQNKSFLIVLPSLVGQSNYLILKMGQLDKPKFVRDGFRLLNLMLKSVEYGQWPLTRSY